MEGLNSQSGQVFLPVLDLVMKSIPAASHGTIHLLDENGERLIAQATSEYGTEVMEKLKMQAGQGIAGLAVQDVEAISVPDVLEDSRFLKYDIAPPFRSLLAVPLIRDARIIGSISITSDRVNAFTPADEVLLERLSTQVAIAIENARLSEEAWPERVAGGMAEAFTARMEDIERVLAQLQDRTQATSVLLADISGQLISHTGMTGSVESATFSALAAGHVSVTAEMAKRAGERGGFNFLLLEGEEQNAYLAHVGKAFLLAVMFSGAAQVGLVRLFTRQAVKELAPLVEELETKWAQEFIGVSFGDALAEKLEQAFGDL